MKLKHLVLSAGTAAMLAVQSCGGSASVSADPSTPEGAIMASAQAVKSNNVSAIVDVYLTPEQRTKIAAEWDKKRKEEPVPDAANDTVKQQIEMLTSGALQEQYMPQVEQMLSQINTDMVSGMIQQVASNGVNDPSLTAAQQEQAKAVLMSMSEWVKSADIANPDNVRKVFTIAEDTVKKLGIKDARDFTALEFDQVLKKGDIILAGFKDIFKVYNINLDESLDSLTIDKVETNGDQSTVTMSYTIFGQKQTFTTTMTKQGNRWFDAESSKKIAEGLSNM